MDFHSIINAAKQNVSEGDYRNGKYYKTKFEAPKKTIKEKKLTSGIRRFLEKQKHEDEQKRIEAQQKKLELQSRRSDKEQRKIEKTLKVIKSSKKFYTGDKELDENTEVTLENSIGDNDDYNFESATSDALYQKLMEKYKKMPPEDKFSSSGKKSKSAALKSEEDTEDYHIKSGHRERVSVIKSDGKSSNGLSSKKTQPSTSTSQNSSSKYEKNTTEKQKPVEKPKPKIRAAPPVDFQQLLKLAEQKQHEDIVIDVPSKKEPERLMTLKEKREFEEIEAARKAKKNGTMARIPKLGAIPKLSDSTKQQDRNNNSDKMSQKIPPSDRKLDKRDNKSEVVNNKQLPSTSKTPMPSSGSKLRDALVKNDRTSNLSPTSSKNINSNNQQRPQVPHASSTKQPQLNGSSQKPISSSSKMSPGSSSSGSAKLPIKEAIKSSKEPQKTRDFPPKDLMRSREFPPKDLMRTREFPPKDLKRPREFPPRDLKRPMSQQQQMSRKRRVIEDEDSEYDSEMDDFIDDGEDEVDVSSEIQKLFGYDKSRYRDEDFDDREMESDYRTVMREEYISKKIGIMEDLEDMKMEAEENRRKEMMRKKRKK